MQLPRHPRLVQHGPGVQPAHTPLPGFLEEAINYRNNIILRLANMVVKLFKKLNFRDREKSLCYFLDVVMNMRRQAYNYNQFIGSPVTE